MKTTDPRDPLDRKIDDLLASRPLQPSPDFSARVLAAAETLPTPQIPQRRASTLLRFALPAAAAIAVIGLVTQFIAPAPASAPAATLSAADIEEIFLLEEGLSGLALVSDDHLSNHDLLSTLDALYFDIQS